MKLSLAERHAALSRQYAAALAAHRHKRAREIYLDLRDVTNALLRKANRETRKAA